MRLLILALCLACSFVAFGQGTTTGSITGQVTDESGVNLPGVTIIALHTPSGTTQGTITNDDGYYRLENLRVGGPYRLSATYIGYGEIALEGIEVLVGESQKFDYVMKEAVTELTTVEVVAIAGNTGESAGASTQVTSEAIERMPTLNRDIDDFLRLTPQAAGYSDGTTFAGVNNRYNAIYIDGAVNNDVFGLASSGTNGGQTGISPFSMDIIDQFQVAISPYDVSLGGFAGAAVNAVTKSGTNNLEGTAYYFFQNENLVGKTNQEVINRFGGERMKIAEFDKRTFGVSLGGPLVKNKLFFFVNAEVQQDAVPTPYDFGSYGGNDNQDSLNALRTFLIESYNYDPGTVGDIEEELDGTKIFAKLDWNLSEKHRLTLRHNYTHAEQLDLTLSTSTQLNFSNTGIFFPSTTHSSAIELNSQTGLNTTNNLIVGFTSVRDDRDPIGSDFPFVLIEDGGSNLVRLGSEEFSTANELNQDIFTITDNFKIYKGAHTFTIGTHNEFYNIYNIFIGQNFGTYRYTSLAAFMNAQQPAKEYDRVYSLVDDITGDGSAAGADFNAMQLGLYVQDEWVVTDRFSLMGGVRLDMPVITDDPAFHPRFDTLSLPLMAQQYEIANEIEPGQAPDGQLMVAPRIGFTYILNKEQRSKLRGGIGIFNSRIPFVWPGAMFNTNGIVQGRVDETNAGEPILFNPDVNTQYKNANFATPSGDVNVFVKDFKYPQVLRGSLGFDFTLPFGIDGTLEGIFTQTLNNVVYTNINNNQADTTKIWSGVPDNRVVYSNTGIDPQYASVYVGSNTDQGDTYTLTASFAKRFDFGLYASLAYNYGDANALNEGTSSQNSSQWRGQMTQQLGRNNPVYGRSDFALGNRIMAVLSQQINWLGNENFATTISLFYDGQAGSPYSYVIGGNSARNINNDRGSTSNNRALVYIPATQSDIRLVDFTNTAGEVVTAQEQWDQLNAYIEDDPYLSGHRGQYAEKNSNWMPYTSFLDFSVRQDLGIHLGDKTHKVQISWDVFNLANLLNSEWGVRYTVPGDFNNFFLYNFTGYETDGTTPKFNYTYGDKLGKEALNINNLSSRWQMRLGLRYMFN